MTMTYHDEEGSNEGVRRHCFQCKKKNQILLRVIITERGEQMTKNRISHCMNIECLQYAPVIPRGWIKDRPDNYVKPEPKPEPEFEPDPLLHQRRREQFEGKSKAKAKNDWRSALVARSERVRALERARAGESTRRRQVVAPVQDFDSEYDEDEEGETFDDFEEREGEDVFDDSLAGP